MKFNNLPEINTIKSSSDFDYLKKLAIENNFFEHLNKYAVSTLNIL